MCNLKVIKINVPLNYVGDRLLVLIPDRLHFVVYVDFDVT